MSGYKIINLSDMVESLGEDRVKSMLLDFSCPSNIDLETFIKQKAITFAAQGWAKTHLVYTDYKDELVLAGYFTLSPKTIMVRKNALSKSLQRKIQQFGTFNGDLKQYVLSAPLIAQLGKNYYNDYNRLITGSELLKFACDRVYSIQSELGGKFVYLECEDHPKLTEFYSTNGFVNFGKRKLDPDETGLKGEYLLQMLKYLKTNQFAKSKLDDRSDE